MKIGHFHHGPVALAAIAAALAERGIFVHGRNADYFTPSEAEAFDKVIVDEGTNTEAIKEFYGDAVVSLEDLIGGKVEPPAPAAQPNLDAKPQPKQAGRNQGATTKQPKAPKQPKPAKVEAPAAKSAEATPGEGEKKPEAPAAQ